MKTTPQRQLHGHVSSLENRARGGGADKRGGRRIHDTNSFAVESRGGALTVPVDYGSNGLCGHSKVCFVMFVAEN